MIACAKTSIFNRYFLNNILYSGVDKGFGFAGLAQIRESLEKKGDEPIDPKKTYTLAGHNYMLQQQGDGFTMFDGVKFRQDCFKLDNQGHIDYITDTLGGVVGEEYADPYGQGRIVIK